MPPRRAVARQTSAYPRLGVTHAALLVMLGQPNTRAAGATPGALAETLGLPARAVLPALAALGHNGLVMVKGRRYRLTDTGVAFLDDNKPAV